MKTINTPISFTNENSQKCVVIAHGAAQNVVVIANDAQACAMREAIPPLNRTMHLLLLLLFLTHFSFAGNFTWTGATNTDWATASNWSGNISGPPSTNDTVSIITQTNLPVLAANTTIKKFTMTSGTLDCNGYILTITSTATFNGGTINNGTVTCSGTSTLTFAGTAFGVVVNATGNNLLFNGSVFNNSLTAVKKGSSNDNSIGNNFFNGEVTLIDSGSGSLVLSNTTSAPDTFNSTLSVSARSTGAVYLAHQGTGNVFNGDVTFSTGNIFSNTYGTAAYNGNITLNSASTNISFGNSTGSWTLASGKNISIGTFSAGTLTIRNLTQSDNSINMRLVLTGTGKLVLGNNSISAKLYASSNQLTFSTTKFLSADTLIYTGGNNATSAGGNYFGSTVYIANTFTGTNYHFTLGSSSVDTFTTTTTIATTGNTSLDVANGLFLGAVTFKNSSTGTLSDRFYVWDCTFKGALTLDGIHSAIKFKNGTGNSLIDSTATLNLVSGYAGQLTLSYIEQRGSNAINLNMSTNTSTGNNTILTIGPNAIFNANFLYLGQRLELNGGTFNGSASFTRFSQQLDVCEGGNVFNGVTQICDSVAATTANRVFKLANTNPDDFNGNVTFKQYGTGSNASTMKMYPAYTTNSTFAGNVTVESNTIPIEFGANGGRVILDGSINDTIKNTGSYIPTIKKLEIKKTGGLATLSIPLTITDSVIFTSGYLKTDSVNLLTIADNCIVTGASDYSAIVGPIKKVGNDAFTFPFGEVWTGPPPIFAVPDYVFHPLTISAPSNPTDAFTAQYFAANHNKGTNADSTIENESICEYWKLTRNSGSSNVTLKLGWNWNSCNVYGLDSMHVAVWDTATSKWKDKGNGGTTGNLTSGTVVSSSAISTFGIMTLADKFCTTLKPVATATDVTCPGNQNGTARVAASGATPPYTYNWSPQTGGSVSLWDLNAGTYHVTVTDSRGCAITDSAIVSDPDSIHLTISATPSNCHETTGTAKIIATGGSSDTYFYFWTPGGEIRDSIGGLAAGVYSVTITDEKGCSLDTLVKINDNDGPETSVEVTANVGCNGYNDASIQLSLCEGCIATDPLTYCQDAAGNPDRLAAGAYPIIVTDSNGCVTIVEATTTQPDPLILVVTTTESLCGDSTGSATVSVTGGTGGYSYKWSSGGSEYEEVNIPSGLDTIFVTDANGCESRAVAVITDSDGPVLSGNSINLTCYDINLGEVSVTASEGAMPYEYSWYEIGQTESSVDSLGEGNYKVFVTDSLGCKSTTIIIISSPPKLSVEISSSVVPTSDSTFESNAMAITQGGTPPYYYLWLPDSQITESISNFGFESQEVIITDNNGCLNRRQIYSSRGSNIACAGTNPLYTNQRDDMNSPCNVIFDPYNNGQTTIDVTDFGAIPGDGLSDECAFEAVNNYIQRNYGHHGNYGSMQPWDVFVVNIPYGSGNGIYNVGRQTLFGETTVISKTGQPEVQDDWFAKGHSIFYLEDINHDPLQLMQINPVLFVGGLGPNGETPKIRFDDCLKFGAFVPNDGSTWGGYRLLLGTREAQNCEIAFIGSCFELTNCNWITIKNLELDGNLPNLTIGGGTSAGAGINENHFGIILQGNALSGSSNITVDNVNIHDFGYAGIEIAPSNYKYRVNLLLKDSKLNKNGCCGFAWESGAGVRAMNCQFNRNALDIITTSEASGIDIEKQGHFHPADGAFTNCEFKYNQRCGVQAGDIGGQRDFIFTNCTFVGTEVHPGIGALKEGNTISMASERCQFHCCNFYGQIITVRDEDVVDNDKTVFNHCNFNDEYYDADDNETYSFSMDCILNCNTAALSEDKTYIVDLGMSGGTQFRRTVFDQCSFKSNYGSAICNLRGINPGGSIINAIQVSNCQFYNGGLNGVVPAFACFPYNLLVNSCGFFLASFTGVNFIGNNSFEYTRLYGCDFSQYGIRNNSTELDYRWDWNACWVNGLPINNAQNGLREIHKFFYTGNCVPDNSLGVAPIHPSNLTISTNYQACPTWRYINYATLQLFSDSPLYDQFVEAEPNDCDNLRIARESYNDQFTGELTVFPSPATNEITINNIPLGEEVLIFDIIGKMMFKKESSGNALSIDVSEFPNGVYYAKLRNSKAVKFIKAY